jgi:hypothetical protein
MGSIRKILTPEDLAKGDLLEPGWYGARISKYIEEPTKGTPEKPSDGSVNAIFVFAIYKNGKEMKRYFNEKALGFGKDLYRALEFPYDPIKGYDLSSELFEQTVGSDVDVYVKRSLNKENNKPYDEIDGFRKFSGKANMPVGV